LALAVFTAISAVLIGPILAVHAAGNVIVLGSLIGCVAVLSLAVRQVILFVRRCQDLELRGEEVFGLSLVERAAREQFTPVLMTALASGLALAPFVYFGPVSGLEIVHPMAVVILWGLVASILINLLILSALYLCFGATPEPEMRFAEADLGSASNDTH
jgi:Cu/Ag efflux pump CusA